MRARWLARLVRPALLRTANRRRPDFEVIRDEDKEVYLRRWWIVPRNAYFNVYLHNMLKDDDPILHDHMYASLSLVLTDGLEEVYCLRPDRSDNRWEHGDGRSTPKVQRRTIREGQVVWRSSRMAHQLLVRRAAWTLFFTGPRIKEWGFWCPRGWRHWKQYVALSQDPSGIHAGKSGRGVGCGEMS